MRGSIATTAPRTLSPRSLSPSKAAFWACGVDGERDAAALGGLVVDQVDDPVDEQLGVAAGQDGVLGRLHAAEAVVAGEEPGEVGVLLGQRVLALELVLVVGLVALGHGLAAHQDGPALAGELRVAHALVVRVLAQRGQVVGLPVLHVGGVDQQRHEQQHAADGEVANWLVHRRILTTWVASAS